MHSLWDKNADAQTKGDNLRKVTPIKSFKDKEDNIHHIFPKRMFYNPWYKIPENDLKFFETFVEGGSRFYPSDGNIPCDIIARELRVILNKIKKYSEKESNIYQTKALKALKHGKKAIVRGTMKLYLGKYTSRDWRRKRFTDDIDFWTFEIKVLEAALKECGFSKNNTTKEWEKKIEWYNPKMNEKRKEILYAANNLNQLLDFGAGSYLEGSCLKEIFQKKIKRGHDVDLSDIINVVMVNNSEDTIHKEEWIESLEAFEEAMNTRNTRTISNIISLCSFSLSIADHLQKVSQSIKKHHDLIFNNEKYPNDEIQNICKISIHWRNYYKKHGTDATRELIHNFLLEQMEIKKKYAKNLEGFSKKILNLLNRKLKHQNVIFEITSD